MALSTQPFIFYIFFYFNSSEHWVHVAFIWIMTDKWLYILSIPLLYILMFTFNDKGTILKGIYMFYLCERQQNTTKKHLWHCITCTIHLQSLSFCHRVHFLWEMHLHTAKYTCGWCFFSLNNNCSHKLEYQSKPPKHCRKKKSWPYLLF